MKLLDRGCLVQVAITGVLLQPDSPAVRLWRLTVQPTSRQECTFLPHVFSYTTLGCSFRGLRSNFGEMDYLSEVQTIANSSAKLSCMVKNGGFPKLRGTVLGVPVLRTVVFWGLYWGSSVLGNYRMCSAGHEWESRGLSTYELLF